MLTTTVTSTAPSPRAVDDVLGYVGRFDDAIACLTPVGDHITTYLDADLSKCNPKEPHQRG
jgi:hypothetical protein